MPDNNVERQYQMSGTFLESGQSMASSSSAAAVAGLERMRLSASMAQKWTLMTIQSTCQSAPSSSVDPKYRETRPATLAIWECQAQGWRSFA